MTPWGKGQVCSGSRRPCLGAAFKVTGTKMSSAHQAIRLHPRQCDSANSRRPSGASHVKAVQEYRPAHAEARSQRRKSCGKGHSSPWARHTWVGRRQQAPGEGVRSPTQPSIRPAGRLRPQNEYLAILLGCRETAIGLDLTLRAPWTTKQRLGAIADRSCTSCDDDTSRGCARPECSCRGLRHCHGG